MLRKRQKTSKVACKVRSFVSDNKNKIKSIREDLQNVFRDELFISYGCAADYLIVKSGRARYYK